MVIGSKYGKTEADDHASRDRTFKLIRQFMEEFRNLNGTVNCTELLGYNLGNEEDMVKARQSGVFHSLCPKMVKDSVQILESLLI